MLCCFVLVLVLVLAGRPSSHHATYPQFHKITTSYYRGAHGIMLIYDVSDRASFGNIEYWIKNIKAHASGNVHVALVGNKTDLRALAKEQNQAGRCVDFEAGKEVADRFSVPYFEVSAKDNSNVDSAFMTVVRSIVAGEGDPPGAGTPRGGGSAGGAGDKKADKTAGKDGAKKTVLGTVFGRAEKSAEGVDRKDKKDCTIS